MRRPSSRLTGIATVNSLEHALRKALEKGDAGDPAFRRRVYEAAATAVQRSLATRGEATGERLAEQTLRLGEAVRAVEADYGAGAVQPPVRAPTLEPAPVPEVDRRMPPAPEPSVAAVVPDPVAPVPAADRLHVEPRPEGRRAPLRVDRGPFATVFAVLVAAAFVFGGLWWVMTSGAFVGEEARDTAVRNPPLRLEEESFAGRDPGTATAPRRAAETGRDGGWIGLFAPSDPTVLRLEGAATASIETDPFGDYARLVTPGGEGRVYVDVPTGALQGLAGRRIQISLRARSDDGAPTQMAVTCDFGPLGDCGRRRFNVDQAETEFLFHVDLPDRAAPREPGFLILRTDIEGGGRAVNLLSARVRAAVE